jgi:hypothetical protein
MTSEFRLPALGADMESGTIVQWNVAPGDRVRRGQVVAVVETDKGAIDVEIFEDGHVVEWTQRAQVDDFRFDARGRELSRRGHAAPQARAVRDQRDIAPRPVNPRGVEVDGGCRLGELALHVVERDRLEDDHRVRALERGLQHATRVVDGRGCHDAESRDVRVPDLETVRVLRSELTARSGRHADHHWHRELAAGHVAQRCRVVHDLVDREQAEVDGHHLDDRPQASHRGADARADERRFRQRRITNPLLAELVQQSLADGEAATVLAAVLAHQEHARIPRKCLADSLLHGFAIRDARSRRGRHGEAPSA